MIEVDKDKCIGCGACVAVCPECFEMKNGISSIKDKDCKSCKAKLEDIADACPMGAIIITGDKAEKKNI